jgi:uncharacterized protein
MSHDAADDVIEVLDEDRCLAYLQAASLGRVAFKVGDEIEILPVNYAADRAIVVFKTAAGTMLERTLLGRAAFEVDGWDPQERVGWSVLIKGVVNDVTTGTDPFSEAIRARNVVPLAPGTRDRWFAIYPAEMTGRRLRRG